MTGRLLSLLLLPLLLASCAAGTGDLLPQIMQPQSDSVKKTVSTPLFPVGRWQFVHSITFHLKTGGGGTALGVLVLDGNSIHCALMSLEGLSLFEARWTKNGPIAVSRALPPFDKPGFAKGLTGDIETIFRSPPGKTKCGLLADGSPICRYVAPSKTTDILPEKDGCWTMLTYTGQVLSRTIHTGSCKTVHATVIPENIHLVYAGPAGYSLNMHLISAEKFQPAK